MQLRGVTYQWKDEPALGDRIGFIAQEVAQVLPGLTFTNPVDGNMGVHYAEVTAVLVEAIQEQQAIIDDQHTRLTALETTVEQLLSTGAAQALFD